jgi:hypothetical protein
MQSINIAGVRDIFQFFEGFVELLKIGPNKRKNCKKFKRIVIDLDYK